VINPTAVIFMAAGTFPLNIIVQDMVIPLVGRSDAKASPAIISG